MIVSEVSWSILCSIIQANIFVVLRIFACISKDWFRWDDGLKVICDVFFLKSFTKYSGAIPIKIPKHREAVFHCMNQFVAVLKLPLDMENVMGTIIVSETLNVELCWINKISFNRAFHWWISVCLATINTSRLTLGRFFIVMFLMINFQLVSYYHVQIFCNVLLYSVKLMAGSIWCISSNVMGYQVTWR